MILLKVRYLNCNVITNYDIAPDLNIPTKPLGMYSFHEVTQQCIFECILWFVLGVYHFCFFFF